MTYLIDKNDNILQDDDPKVLFYEIAIFLSSRIVCLRDETIKRIVENMFNSGILNLLEESETFRELECQNWIQQIVIFSEISWWSDVVADESSYYWVPNEEIVLWAILFESLKDYELSHTNNTLYDIYTTNLQYFCDPRCLGRSWYNDITVDFKESMKNMINEIDAQKRNASLKSL